MHFPGLSGIMIAIKHLTKPGGVTVKPKNVTIKDIAREANVSIATVSNVINNKGRVSEETREVGAGPDRQVQLYA